ncbi:beta-propeller domain-containing protein [Gilvimarinus agarilyticus]|uniref:beta-propeller domain-containing protein n=1 Tax=Gilvimarinus sp. 2_MG-2023 TaxID=3062666 RepID=UPI001C086E4F|nr:beta-propeller domain-containing protein [Gilvimarinus sp. 2_MG-2023]MBU2887534.1 beta-propeller domain-containing protein [Gilvimarinus agarilyticus]MDO6572185.1 beta-propeller domain-containing protein [Gilvimarinus sp. 2_MG-2023]
MRVLVLGLVATLGLSACGGSSSSDTPGGTNPSGNGSSSSLSSLGGSDPAGSSSSSSQGSSVGSGGSEPVDYEPLKPAQVDSKPLQPIAGQDLTHYLANGFRLQTGGFYPEKGVGGEVDFSASPVEGSNDGAGDYSDTNVHVAGVDEADVAKYDGAHWFVSYVPENAASNLPGIQVFATDPDTPSAQLAGSYSFAESDWGEATSLYLHKEADLASHVIAIRNQWGNIYPLMPGGAPDIVFSADIWPGPVNSEFRLEFIDVSNPALPQLENSISIDGALINSRQIGDTLYLVSRFDPWLNDLHLEHDQENTRADNEQVLAQASLADILPGYRVGSVEAPLTEECLVQSSVDEHTGYYSVVNITAIDLSSQSVLASQCLSTAVDDMTMSTDALYITGSNWSGEGETTTLHKFNLTAEGPEYAATGAVSGTLRGRAPFRVHQAHDKLRVVTSQWQGELTHHLFVLEQSGQSLDTIAELPNANRSQAIGKPGEDIYAVRFTQDKAYIVTFRQVDPFYVVDLTNPLDPKISGELEVPGFATYIHPINDQYIFTLGQNVDSISGWTDGIKAQLIQVEAGVPTLAGEVNIGQQGSSSEALYDLRALSFLADTEDNLRVAFPVKVQARVDQAYATWQYSGLQMLELQGLQGDTATMLDKGTLVAEAVGSEQWDSGVGPRRGLLHDDAVFYAHNNQVWAAQWGDASNPSLPVGGEPIACTEELRYGLHVNVWAEEADACSASVTATDGEYQETLTQIDSSWGSCYFQGAQERAGTYDITVELAGYASQALAGIVVSRDLCHVQTAMSPLT